MEHLISSMKKSMGALGWSAFVAFVAMRVGDVANMVTAIVLGLPGFMAGLDFGALSPVFSFLAVLSLPVSVLCQVGTKSISRLYATGHEDQRRALVQDLGKVVLAGAVVSVLVVYVLRDVIFDRLHLDTSLYVHLVAGLFVLAWIQPLVFAVLQGEHRYGVLALPSVVGGGAILLFTWVLVVVLQGGLPGALLARIMTNVVVVAAVFLVLRRSFIGARRPYGEEVSGMWRMLPSMAAYAVSSTALIHFDRLLVRSFIIEQSPGYQAVVTFGSIPSYFLGALTFVLFPIASGAHAKGRDLDRYRKVAALAGLLVTACCATFFAVAGQFVFHLWNPQFEPYAGALWVYAAAMGLHSLIDILVSVELARHRYGFAWLLLLPAGLYCAVLYGIRASISVTIVVWAAVAVRVVVLACLWQYGSRRREEADPPANEVQSCGSA